MNASVSLRARVCIKWENILVWHSSMRVNLNVPFSEKNAAKALGAHWDAANRTWYSEDDQNIARFKVWLPHDGLSEALPLAIESENKIGISLSSFLSKVKEGFDQHCALTSWVKAEVMEFRDKNGHCYITLAEYAQDEVTLHRQELARINCNLWKHRSKTLQDKFYDSTGTKIKVGMKIMLLAKADYHTKYGVSLTILDIDPSYTLGDLEANLRKIRSVLEAEGIYKRNKAYPIPKDFTYVAVIAPQDGAGLGDFRQEANLLSQHGLCQFDYYKALFQGEGAADAILSSLEKVSHKADLYDAVIIIRGGGAATDLAWLNNILLARRVCTFGLPVFSGIGHERDNTILDEIACCRFDTPSKVSHFILNVICENAKKAEDHFLKISHSVHESIQRAYEKISAYQNIVKMSSHYFIDRCERNLEHFRKVLPTARRVISVVQDQLIQNYNGLSSDSLKCIESVIRLVSSTHERALKQSLYLSKVKENELNTLYIEAKSLCLIKLQETQKQINHLEQNVLYAASYQIELQQGKLASNYGVFKTRLYSLFENMTYKLESFMREVLPHDPKKTLLRGFALVRNDEGKVVDSSKKAKAVRSLEIQFRDGTLMVYNKLEEK